MNSQQSQSQAVSESQTHSDFLVGIATENASLKVQIKQEYDNSCGRFVSLSDNWWLQILRFLVIYSFEKIFLCLAIVHQINKSAREIDSCKRDLNKFKELQEAKFAELKRLEGGAER